MKTKLPPRVYEKHGSLWFVDLDRKWHKLCRASEGLAAMYLALAKINDAPTSSSMPGAIAEFQQSTAFKKNAAGTQKEHGRLLDIAAAEFVDFDVAQVDTADILQSCENLFGGRPTAARSYKARLSTFFRWAIAKRLRADNPCREAWLDAPPKRDRYITDDEFIRIREAMLLGDDGRPTRAGQMAQVFVDLCYLTAQRPTDIRRLLWSQVRADGLAFKPTKTAGSSGAKVVIPATPAIQDALERAKAFGAVRSVFVVHTLDGSPYTMSGIRSAWVRACKRAGVTGATIKDLRPKALTDAKRAGYGIEELKVAAAHSSVTTTEGYMKTFDEPVSVVRLTLPTRGK
jgi:integrase